MYEPAKTATAYKTLFAKKDIVLTSIISLIYLLLSKILIGFRGEQLFLVILCNTLYYLTPGTRKFVTGFSIFIVYWIIFDYMKAFPNYAFNKVHIEGLYSAEKSIFGIKTAAGVLTPNEFFLANTNVVVDFLCGFFYLCWIPLPLAFGAYLFYTRREQFYHFAFTFFLVNILGFIVYYSFPAAPPWYVQLYGNQFHPLTPGNTAGLHRFDQIIGSPLFEGLYSKSSNVFAAMPSLHSSYPLIVLYYGFKNRLGWINTLFALVVAGIWFAAVYTSHHYVLDVLGGITCGSLGIFIFQKWIKKNKYVDGFIEKNL